MSRKRNKFNLSYDHMFTADMGKLIPIGCIEVLPGDSIQMATSALIRTTPLLAPVMTPVHVNIHHWFVPTRQVWQGESRDGEGNLNSWETFITGGRQDQTTGELPTALTHPHLEVATGDESTLGSIFDYFGIPAGTGALAVGLRINSLPLRAFNRIYNFNYRDEQLVDPLYETYNDGADDWTDFALQPCNWRKDYFTTARRFPQVGAGVTMDLNIEVGDNTLQQKWRMTGGTTLNAGAVTGEPATGDVQVNAVDSYLDPNGTYVGRLDLNDLRFSIATLKDQEARNLYGFRYLEYCRYIGASTRASTLDEPLYLGGGRQTIQFSEVLQTGVTTSGNAAGVGNLKGHGIGALRSNRFRKYFEEHGYIISLMSVNPITIYPQGLFRMWNRATKYDYFNPEFEHVGQQDVLNKEVKANHASPNSTFGYANRFDDYRRMESRVSSEFRTPTGNYWHMGRIFSSDPSLNDEFVQANPTNRIYATTAVQQLQVMCHHSIQARRHLSKDGNPGGMTI